MNDVRRLSNNVVRREWRLLPLPPPLGEALHAEGQVVPMKVVVYILQGDDGLVSGGGQAEEGVLAEGTQVAGGGQEEVTLSHAPLVHGLWDEGRHVLALYLTARTVLPWLKQRQANDQQKGKGPTLI